MESFSLAIEDLDPLVSGETRPRKVTLITILRLYLDPLVSGETRPKIPWTLAAKAYLDPLVSGETRRVPPGRGLGANVDLDPLVSGETRHIKDEPDNIEQLFRSTSLRRD